MMPAAPTFRLAGGVAPGHEDAIVKVAVSCRQQPGAAN